MKNKLFKPDCSACMSHKIHDPFSYYLQLIDFSFIYLSVRTGMIENHIYLQYSFNIIQKSIFIT